MDQKPFLQRVRRADRVLGAVLAVALVGGAVFLSLRAGVSEAPRFEVDPLWPKPLPNHWVIGSAIGVSVDAQDHVWIVHRPGSLNGKEIYAALPTPAAICCKPAPPVLEFDPAGNLLHAWGGPPEPGSGYKWPTSNHGITVDYKGNVWIGGNDASDTQVLKFTQEGKFLMRIGGGESRGSNDTANLHSAAKIFVDPGANEAYISDGYGNHRVIVFDADSGAYKRHWGAYGNKPDDKDLGPYNPAAPVAKQKEAFIEKNTLGDGSVFDITFSKDPDQKFLFVADGANDRIHVLLRDSLEEITNFGDGGRQPGQFYAVHSIASDSKGNLYTTETYEGKRLQKFVFKGLAPAEKKEQGVVWPQSK
jgi:hypothetical protein